MSIRDRISLPTYRIVVSLVPQWTVVNHVPFPIQPMTLKFFAYRMYSHLVRHFFIASSFEWRRLRVKTVQLVVCSPDSLLAPTDDGDHTS